MKISDEIIKVLDYLGQKIGVTIDWTSKNVLPFVEQLCEKYISWEIATSLLWSVLGIVLLIAGLCFIRPAKNAWRRGAEDTSVICWIITIALVVAGVSTALTQGFDIIECKTFPEKAIYDYIQNKISTTQTIR